LCFVLHVRRFKWCVVQTLFLGTSFNLNIMLRTRQANIIDSESSDDKKSRISTTDSPRSGTGTTSPGDGPVVNQLDDAARETFATGRPLEDSPDMQTCKRCGKSILKSTAKAHIESCTGTKKWKKKDTQAKEKGKAATDKDKDKEKDKDKDKATAKPKEKKIVVGDEDGEAEDEDDAEGEEEMPKKATGTFAGGIKSAKKSAGKKTGTPVDGEKKGKKRKADADAEKAPKAKKKKEEPKPKAPKPKGGMVHDAVWHCDRAI
jgi:SAGA-associated factor 73